MLNMFQSFREDTSGAVTVDWVILTAFVVGLATVIYISIEDNSEALITAAGGAIAAENDF